MRHRRLPRVDLAGRTYFLGCNVHDREPLLRDARLAQLILELYAAARQSKQIALHAYVVMPDHYHILLTLWEAPSISDLVRALHSPFVRQAHALGVRPGRLWQRRPFDHVIRDERDFFEHVEYVHHNPVKAGLVQAPAEYHWSSAAFWEGGESPVPCDGPRWD